MFVFKKKVLSRKHVRLNKDASDGRDEDRIADRYLSDLIAGYFLQIVCKCITGFYR